MSEYIGRRIVPVHGGVWDGSKAYEELTIVLYEASGDSYISRRPVPAGTVIGDKNYWMLYSLYSQQIADAVKEMQETDAAVRAELSAAESRMENRVTEAEKLTNQNKSNLNSRMDGIDRRLDANVSASTDAAADYAAEVVDARVGTDETTYQNLGSHLRALGAGTAIQALDADKVRILDLSMGKIYELAMKKTSKSFEYSYEEGTDSMRIACVEDYPGDFIIYAPVVNARDYAALRMLGANLLIKYSTKNVSNDSGAFKFGLWLAKMNDAETSGTGAIFRSTYTHAFKTGSEDNTDTASIGGTSLEYDPDLGCFVYEGKPVNLQFLLYANNAKAGDEVTISGFGNLFYGLGKNGAVNALAGNMLRAETESLRKAKETLQKQVDEHGEQIEALIDSDYQNCRVIDFIPDSVFAPDDSICEIVEDEYGDQSYRLTHVNNNPMYQMNITNILPESCREVIVELTARRLSEGSQIRVHMYDRNNGMSHSNTAIYFGLTDHYRRYQFRISRVNAGSTTLGIGPRNTAGTSIQFKNVRILIPDERSKQLPQPLKYFQGYLGNVDFSKMEEVILKDPVLCGIDDYVSVDGLYLDTIELYCTKQRAVKFYVGCIDQYGLFQELSRFSTNVRKGRNLVKFDDLKISVPAGYGIFAAWTAEMAVYADPPEYGFHNLVSTKSDYYENEQGYSGYPLRQTGYMVPMRYTLTEKTLPVKLDEVSAAIDGIREETAYFDERISGLEEGKGTGGTNVMVSPDGVKYYLTVKSDGTLDTICSVPRKVLVLGNSLTLGFGTFGMAASDSKHDYYYYVKEFLQKKNSNLEMSRCGASNWEGMTTSEERRICVQGFLDSYTDGTEDLVIIQLSDNVNTDEKRETYAEDVRTMLQMFRDGCPRARILWVAAWYGWTLNYGPIETACNELGVDLVDIRDLSEDAANKNAVGNTYTKDDGIVVEITSSGVASHPGDTGMRFIADRIIERLKSYM